MGEIKARLNITVKDGTIVAIQKQESAAVRYSSRPLHQLPTFFAEFNFEQAIFSSCWIMETREREKINAWVAKVNSFCAV